MNTSKLRLRGLLPLLALSTIAACGGSSGGGGGADTTAPAAPANLVAAGGTFIVTLDWDTNGEGDLAGYRVYRALVTGGPYTEITSSLQATSDYIDSGLTTAGERFYVVTAEDTTGNESVDSMEVSATPVTGPTDLDYGSPTALLARGIQAEPLVPTFNGLADNFAVTSGTLPAGLTIDAADGTISGLPSAAQAAATVTVTASLSGGSSDTFDIDFTVNTPSVRAMYSVSEVEGLLLTHRLDAAGGFANVHDYETGLDSPRDLALTSDLEYLYVINSGTGTIQGYAVDALSAELTELAGSPFAMLGGIALAPRGIATSPDGQYVYTANKDGNSISMFSVGAGGALTELAGSPFGAYSDPQDILSMRVGTTDMLYIVASGEATNRLISFTIDAGGLLTEVDADTTEVAPVSLKSSARGGFLYVLNQSAALVSGYTIETDGTLTELVSSPYDISGLTTFPFEMEVATDGASDFVYTTDNFGVITQQIAAVDGSLSVVAPGSFSIGAGELRGLVSSPGGEFLYVLDQGIEELDNFAIAATGALSELPGMFRNRMPGDFIANLILPSIEAPVWGTTDLYATNQSGGSVAQFQVDPAGMLTPRIPLSVLTETSPEELVVNAKSSSLYVSHPGSATAPLMTTPILATGELDGSGQTTTAAAADSSNFLTLSPNAAFVFSAGTSNNSVSTYPVNPDGSLGTQSALSATGILPFDVAITPEGRHLYVTNFVDATVSQFSVDLATGALTPKSSPTAAAGANPRSVVVHPSGRYVYVTAAGTPGPGGDLLGQYNVNFISGELNLMGTPSITVGTDPGAIAVTPNGDYVIIANSDAGTNTIESYLVNSDPGNAIENGSLSGPIDTAAVNASPHTLEISADGTLVFVGSNSSGIVESFSLSAAGLFTAVDSESIGGTLRSIGALKTLE